MHQNESQGLPKVFVFAKFLRILGCLTAFLCSIALVLFLHGATDVPYEMLETFARGICYGICLGLGLIVIGYLLDLFAARKYGREPVLKPIKSAAPELLDRFLTASFVGISIYVIWFVMEPWLAERVPVSVLFVLPALLLIFAIDLSGILAEATVKRVFGSKSDESESEEID